MGRVVMASTTVQSSVHTPPTAGLPSKRRRRPPSIPRAQSIYEGIALALLAVPAVAGIWLFGAVRIWSFGPLIVSSMAGALMTLIEPFFFRDAKGVRIPPGGLIGILFLAWAIALVRGAAVPYAAWIEVLRIASYVAAYWAWTALAGHGRRWRWLLGCLLVSGTLMAWYALIQHGQESRMVLTVERPQVYAMRASGAYICPNHFASLLEMLIPLGVALACCPSAGMPIRLLGGYSVLVFLPPLFLSQSRSGWIGAVAGFTATVCILALRKSTRRFLVVLCITPLVVASAAWLTWESSPMVRERVADAMRGNVRLQLWQDTASMIREQPWMGHGPGSYRWVYPHFKRHMTAYLDPQFAHNDYLHTLAEYGAIGLFLCAAAVLAVVLRTLPALRRIEHDKDACMVAGFIGAMAAALAHACFDYNLQIFANVHVLVMMAGITAARLFCGGTLLPVAAGSRWSRRVCVPVAIVAVLLMFSAGQVVASYAYNRRGDTRRTAMDYDAARGDYKRSMCIDSRNWSPYLGMAHILRTRSFWNLDAEARKGNAKEAEVFYREALARNPLESSALLGLSKLYAAVGDQQKSLAVLEDLVAKVPFHRLYLTELGLRLRQMGRYQEALSRFLEASHVENTEMIDLNIRWLQEKIGEGNPKPE
ncbi:MAG: O-antigen ligase family protein [bacterium]